MSGYSFYEILYPLVINLFARIRWDSITYFVEVIFLSCGCTIWWWIAQYGIGTPVAIMLSLSYRIRGRKGKEKVDKYFNNLDLIFFVHKFLPKSLIQIEFYYLNNLGWSWLVNPSLHLLKASRSSSQVMDSSPTFPFSTTFSTLSFMLLYIICNIIHIECTNLIHAYSQGTNHENFHIHIDMFKIFIHKKNPKFKIYKPILF